MDPRLAALSGSFASGAVAVYRALTSASGFHDASHCPASSVMDLPAARPTTISVEPAYRDRNTIPLTHVTTFLVLMELVLIFRVPRDRLNFKAKNRIDSLLACTLRNKIVPRLSD